MMMQAVGRSMNRAAAVLRSRSVLSIVPNTPSPSLSPIPSPIPKIRLVGISKSFEGNCSSVLHALHDINLTVKAGEFVCIVGPSGCGKSTLLHIMAGLSKPDAGKAIINEQPIRGSGPDRILIFQELGLFPWLSVVGNVEFAMRWMPMSRDERRERALRLLDLVHLRQFGHSYIHQLSGGMRQRVALARALAAESEVLLMDEPFAALDAQTRDMLHDELEKIWNATKCTIIFVTHNVREAVRLGDRVVLLTFRPGRIKREFPIGLQRPRHLEDPQVALGAREILDELRDEIHKTTQAEYQR